MPGLQLMPGPDREGAFCLQLPLLAVLGLLGGVPALTATSTADGKGIERLAHVRVPFVENRGQLSGRVAFSAATFSETVFVTRDGKLVYSLPPAREGPHPRKRIWSNGSTMSETFVSGKLVPAAGPRAATNVSYFLGNDQRRWQNGLRTYDEIRLGEVWRGISVALRAHGGSVEKIFTLLPGAPVEKIRLRLDGASFVQVDRDGSLVAGTGKREIRFAAPAAYQERSGVRRAISVAYAVDGLYYGFRLGRYDRARALVIDPILQSTYLGGFPNNSINALAIHPASGEVLVAGLTLSGDFPGTSGGSQSANGGAYDGFVARLDPTLTTLLQVTYLGGSQNDDVTSITVHPTSGEVLVTGITASTDFPGTTGGAQPTPRTVYAPPDGFVARLNPTLTSLLQATYLGGGNEDFPIKIAVHPLSGEVLVAGETDSADFPGTAGGAQPAMGSPPFPLFLDGFVARLNPTLTTLLQATYLGGNSEDFLRGLAVNPSNGEILVAGATASADFPCTTGGAQPSLNGSFDTFTARLDPTLTKLLQSTYLGGSDTDFSYAIAVHPSSGDVLIAGNTYSVDFPGTAGGAQSAFAGAAGRSDGFVARLNSALTTVLQSTYLGGRDFDTVTGIAADPTTGEVLVAGETSSIDFPGTAAGAQSALGGPFDTFVARISPTLTALLEATYLGGSDLDAAKGILLNLTRGEVVVAGFSYSVDFPETAGGAQPGFSGGYDGFAARLKFGIADAVSREQSRFVDTTRSGDSQRPMKGRRATRSLALQELTRPASRIRKSGYEFFGKLMEGNGHAYAPAIIHEGGLFHMFYCGSPVIDAYAAWDAIRYSYSSDGRSWSPPEVVVKASNSHTERAACDPSVVYYDAGDGPYYYLFYTGSAESAGSVMFVARSASIRGPFQKLTERSTWESNAPDPKIIVYPKHPIPDGEPFWGAGEQTVVVENGTLYSWYFDDTALFPDHGGGTFFTSTRDPRNWPTGQLTNADARDVDVKYDPAANRFVMFDVGDTHAPGSYLSQRLSEDGLDWTRPAVLCDSDCFPDWVFDVGVSGDREGHLLPEPILAAYGAPKDVSPIYLDDCILSPPPFCQGYWDLFGTVIPHRTPRLVPPRTP